MVFMIEIRIHGRGGQGAVSAAELLAIAAFRCGKYSQAFPSFGPERSGAPVESYCRISDMPIKLRAHIYNPNYIIVLDESLLGLSEKGLQKDSVIVINSKDKRKTGFRSYNIDATSIALKFFTRPIVNTVMLGAFAKATKLVTLESLEDAIKEKFSGSLAEKNIKAIKAAYNEMKV